ncbi:MAG: hypothetical protein L0Z68_10770 [Gammaproteobacteria bacterium]|nr:hypothetical protein [Gammaproteobacteria bacterium]
MSLPHAPSGAHTWLVLLVGLITLAGTLWIPPGHAIGPTLPLRFEELPETKDTWVVGLLVDPEQIRVVRIERHVYADDERLRVESIEAKYERQPIDEHVVSRVQLPLFKEMEKLKQKRAFARAQQKTIGGWS